MNIIGTVKNLIPVAKPIAIKILKAVAMASVETEAQKYAGKFFKKQILSRTDVLFSESLKYQKEINDLIIKQKAILNTPEYKAKDLSEKLGYNGK